MRALVIGVIAGVLAHAEIGAVNAPPSSPSVLILVTVALAGPALTALVTRHFARKEIREGQVRIEQRIDDKVAERAQQAAISMLDQYRQELHLKQVEIDGLRERIARLESGLDEASAERHRLQLQLTEAAEKRGVLEQRVAVLEHGQT